MRISASPNYFDTAESQGYGPSYDYVDKTTKQAHNEPTLLLALREAGQVALNGEVFIFSLNPQQLRIERRARVGVQDFKNGYLVTQAGLGAPRFSLRGNFGWQLKSVRLPNYIDSGAAGNIRYDAISPQFGGRTDFDTITTFITQGQNQVDDNNSYVDFFKFDSGVSINAFHANGISGTQTLDGRQAWFRLRDIVRYYFEENMKRASSGKPLFEMVFFDTLHTLKWVVVPEGEPTLERRVETQGLHPYTLELVGVYNALRGRPSKVSDLWS